MLNDIGMKIYSYKYKNNNRLDNGLNHNIQQPHLNLTYRTSAKFPNIANHANPINPVQPKHSKGNEAIYNIIISNANSDLGNTQITSTINKSIA